MASALEGLRQFRSETALIAVALAALLGACTGSPFATDTAYLQNPVTGEKAQCGPFGVQSKSLRSCISAYGEKGFVFVPSLDAADRR